MKEKILQCKLDNPTWGYRKIGNHLECSPNTVKYYLKDGEREKSKLRVKNYRYRVHPISKKMKDFKTASGRFSEVLFKFSQKDVLAKIGDTPKCYLTGRPIDILSSKSYHFDHILPVSKGGDSSLENLGLTCKEANIAKSDLTLPEFIQIAKELLENFGYTVSN